MIPNRERFLEKYFDTFDPNSINHMTTFEDYFDIFDKTNMKIL